jgi:ATP phosphoribosyltransferase
MTALQVKRPKEDLAAEVYDAITATAASRRDGIAVLCGLLTQAELEELVVRDRIRAELQRSIMADSRASFSAVAKICGASEKTVSRVYRAMRDEYPPPKPKIDSNAFCLAVPKEARALEIVEGKLIKAGFSIHLENKRKGTGYAIDMQDQGLHFNIEFIRGGDMPLDMQGKKPAVQLAFVGNDKISEFTAEQQAKGQRKLEFNVHGSFDTNAFRMCIAVPKEVAEEANQQGPQFLKGKRIATSYPHTLRQHLREEDVRPRQIVSRKGGVERTVQRGRADAIMDIVETGTTLDENGLVAVGQPLYPGEMNIYSLKGANMGNQLQRIEQFCERVNVANPQPRSGNTQQLKVA